MDSFPADATEYMRDLELPPHKQKGWVHEVEVPMREGESFDFETESGLSGGVEFNVHSHQGPEVTYHVKGSEPNMAGTFTAPWEGKFYLMWENHTNEIIPVRIRATRREIREGTRA
ncbi:MAG TPA: hypothetical protein VJ400_06285 [Thermoplasmata archaeon]|nr:hypothetical protein [Thermoplasmata archaeon]